MSSNCTLTVVQYQDEILKVTVRPAGSMGPVFVLMQDNVCRQATRVWRDFMDDEDNDDSFFVISMKTWHWLGLTLKSFCSQRLFSNKDHHQHLICMFPLITLILSTLQAYRRPLGICFILLHLYYFVRILIFEISLNFLHNLFAIALKTLLNCFITGFDT